MVSRCSIGILVLCISSFAVAQPRIEFDTAAGHIGPVYADTILHFAFPFWNTGDSVLIIDHISHGDGGLSGAYPSKNNIAPGDSASVRVSYMPASRGPGPWKKTLMVYSNAVGVRSFSFGGEILPFDSVAFYNNFPYPDLPKPKIMKINDDVYVFITYKDLNGAPFPANGLIMCTSRENAVLVDAGFDSIQAEQVYGWVERSLKRKVVACVITHAHDDRYGGIQALIGRGVQPFVTRSTEAWMADKRVYLKYRTLFPWDHHSYHRFFEVFQPGAGHSPDNIVVYIPTYKILFGGCMVKSIAEDGLGNLKDANLRDWSESLKRVKKEFPDMKIVIPGHHAWGGPENIDHTLKMLEEYQNEKK